MNKKAIGIIQLIGSIAISLLLYFYFYKFVNFIGIRSSSKAVLRFIKYFLMSLSVFVIYRSNVHSGKNKFTKAMLNSLIITIACFVFLIFVTILLNKLSIYLINKNIMYPFVNYFKMKFTVSSTLNLLVDCIFIPYLLCMIFVLGISNVIRKSWTSAILSGLSYACVYAYSLKSGSFQTIILSSIIPGVIFMLLTYLYKNNKNIWTIILIYILYVLCGSLVINYII